MYRHVLLFIALVLL